MKIGLIDVDGHNFPNLPLMKISAYHKAQGDSVEWYNPMWSGYCDIVYMSKIFSFTPDYPYFIEAGKIIKGGSGYNIKLIGGKEIYNSEKNNNLPYEIEHIYPDYSLYPDLTKDTAYGFLTRGCPRGCGFCHVAAKEGRCSYKVADLSEFWNGQRNIKLLDPNLLACKEHEDLIKQLIDSKAWVDFTQGLDIRLVNDNNIELLRQVKVKMYHFAWDNPDDALEEKFKWFKEVTGQGYWKMGVYVLTNFNSTHEQDRYRVDTLKEIGYNPYIMVYDKEHAPELAIHLQRYVNNRKIFRSGSSFEDYLNTVGYIA